MEVRVENIQKKYSKFELNCSLEVKDGQVTGLIGKNGAGKSTTFKALLGLIPLDAGQVSIGNKTVDQLKPKDREDIGVVLAESGFSGYLMIKDLVPILEAMFTKFDKQNFQEECLKMELPLDKSIKEFSTGMKAKLKVLVAMSHGASLLVLDEPTAGLDVMARNEILDMLREYIEKNECSILISSHISSDLESLCDDFYMIDDGKVIMHEDTDVLLGSYGLIKVSEEEYAKLDKKYLIRKKKESFGLCCLTKEKQFYLDNYPGIVIEKGKIDDVIMMMIQGERL